MNALCQAEISLATLKHNFEVLQQAAPNSQIMAVIKANAYGHGAIESAKALSPICNNFAVARIEEAISLREAGIKENICVLSGVSNEHFGLCEKYQLHVVLHTLETLECFLTANVSTHFWIKFDTGMHRLGISADEITAVKTLLASSDQNPIGILSHFSNADDIDSTKNQLQLESFIDLSRQIKCEHYSLANSAAILFNDKSHFSITRPGIALYGANPSNAHNATSEKLQAVMRLTAKVINIQQLQLGEAVGYNERWHAEKTSTIATIAIGYADGYPRHAPNGTPVFINGKNYPLVGTVSMDLITVDVTGCNINIGDIAELWGKNLKVETIAGYAQTISYELLSKVTDRVLRTYIK